jgi:hypothetical protein
LKKPVIAGGRRIAVRPPLSGFPLWLFLPESLRWQRNYLSAVLDLFSLKSTDDGLNVISVFFRERFSDRTDLLHNRVAKHGYSSISSSGVQMIAGSSTRGAS